MWLFQHSSNCELWRHCWCWRRHPRCLHFSCTASSRRWSCLAVQDQSCSARQPGSSHAATGAPRPLTPSTPRSRRWRRRQSRRWRRRLYRLRSRCRRCRRVPRGGVTACRAHCSSPVLARRGARLRAEAEATTIRVNTKSAEGAKAALLSSEFP